LPAIDQRHPQRPVLVRQAADFAMLTFDHGKDWTSSTLASPFLK
jgi:hypothetical protein